MRSARWQILALLPFAAFASLALSCDGGETEETDEEEGDEIADQWNQAYDEYDLKDECNGVFVPDRTGFGKKVALTFDDGPNTTTTPRILDTLKEHGIKALFLINGSRVTGDAQRAVLRRIVDEGHLLGNHTHNHQNATQLSESAFRQQVEKTDAIIRETGVTPRWFRFPFGASTCATAEAIQGYGYVKTGWHVDSADWCFASGGGRCPTSTFRHVDDQYRDDMAGLTMSQVARTQGGIVLFHDIHANTANALEGIIDRMVDGGYTFTNVDDTLTFPKLNGATPSANWVGTACTTDAPCDYVAGAYCLGEEDGAGACSMPCEGTCPDKAGAGTTFCATINAVGGEEVGACILKADAGNEQCAALPGTRATTVDRFIGSSSSSAATATVCLP